MESNSLTSFVIILRESLLIFLKSRSLMANIALFNLLLHSLLFSCNYLSIEPLTKDFLVKLLNLFFELPDSSQFTKIVTIMSSDFHKLIGLQWFFILALSMASLLSSSISVSASALTYAEEKLSPRDLLSSVFKSCKRLIVTGFYISLFDLGYFFLVFSLVFPFTVNFDSSFRPTTFLYVILFMVSAFRMYLAVFWNMSIVVSVLEEKSGLESFGKTSQILKGFKLQGFLLSLVYGVPILILNIWFYMKIVQKGTYHPLLMGLILLNTVILIKMLLVDVGFTVLYHKCKLRHEEDVELLGIMGYNKVLSNNEPMIGAEVP